MSKRIEAKYAIIGLGILGSAVLKKLLEQGEHNIVVLEKETNFGGATAHSFGMLRVFHDSNRMRDLALQSFREAVRSPEAKLAERRPFLSLRPYSAQLFEQVQELKRENYSIEVLSPAQINSQYGLNVRDPFVGLLEKQALTFDPVELLQAYHQATLPRVQVVRDHASHILEDANGICIITQGGQSVRVEKVVVAAGIGSAELLTGRGISLRPKPIEYNVTSQNFGNMPQLLDSQTHEFISQRKDKSYYRFQGENQLGKQLQVSSKQPQRVMDVASDISQETFGRIPGSKRIYFMGAWSGNAFKLSWHLSTLICECLRSKTIQPASIKGATHANYKVL